MSRLSVGLPDARLSRAALPTGECRFLLFGARTSLTSSRASQFPTQFCNCRVLNRAGVVYFNGQSSCGFQVSIYGFKR